MELKNGWIEQGFIDEPAPAGVDLKSEILRMCEEKKAVIMAHYYTEGEVQDVADFVGDSLALARKAAETDAKIIVMCGVHFMAETCKILSPEKLVLAPDLNAGCSLADSCRAEDLKRFKEEHPDHQVVSYVNTTAAVKALTDVVVTSGNARKIIDTFPKDAKIIFGPDKNLGSYINSVTGRQMLLWQGGCHVHERFTADRIMQAKTIAPNAKVLAHPECKSEVLALADVIGSTAVLLDYAIKSSDTEFIVVTESGILHEMQKNCPEKRFIPVRPAMPPAADGSSANGLSGVKPSATTSSVATSHECNKCEYMRMNTLLKIYNTLKYEWPSIDVDPTVVRDAVKPIERMLSLS